MKWFLLTILFACAGAVPAAESLSGGVAPSVAGGPWLNSPPLDVNALRGRVVLVEFWTYGCFNCRHVEPHIKQWWHQYAPSGLMVVAVHAPEFAAERELTKVAAYVRSEGIGYPVVLDNDFAIWRRFANKYWPTLYLIDRQGRLRYRHIGEGDYAPTQRWIERLLSEHATK